MYKIQRFLAKDKNESKGAVSPLERQFSTIEQPKGSSMRDLVAGRRMAVKTGVLCFMWFTAALSSYASDLNMGTLGGDFYHNQFIIGTVVCISKSVDFLHFMKEAARHLLVYLSTML